jgi:hypothetical protein
VFGSGLIIYRLMGVGGLMIENFKETNSSRGILAYGSKYTIELSETV